MCVCMKAHTSIQKMNMNLKYVWAQQHCLNFLGKLGRDGLLSCFSSLGASLAALRVKNLPAMKETQVQSLSWEDPLEKGVATHSSILVWRIPWTEETGGLQSMGLQIVEHN